MIVRPRAVVARARRETGARAVRRADAGVLVACRRPRC